MAYRVLVVLDNFLHLLRGKLKVFGLKKEGHLVFAITNHECFNIAVLIKANIMKHALKSLHVIKGL
jgi:hypothetical protein